MQAKTGDLSYLLQLKEKRRAVTSEDIQRVITEYFTDNNKTVAYIVKPDSEMDNTDQSGLTAPQTDQAVAK
jgi:predicted Zn-dependent peptidase